MLMMMVMVSILNSMNLSRVKEDIGKEDGWYSNDYDGLTSTTSASAGTGDKY